MWGRAPVVPSTLKEEAPELLDASRRGNTGAEGGHLGHLRVAAGTGGGRGTAHGFSAAKRRETLILPSTRPVSTGARDGEPSLDVLSLIPGVEVSARATLCMAGTYSYRWRSTRNQGVGLGRGILRFMAAQGPVSLTACDSETCRWQLEHGTTIPRPSHPIEVLAAAYGLYPFGGSGLGKKTGHGLKRICPGAPVRSNRADLFRIRLLWGERYASKLSDTLKRYAKG